ncbi:MAG TPA: hypothetical protein DCZ91_14315 [Lachnospiraceae bacterium]|nr:hypothetical protein [Lachnospiraceae bacterium]
MIYIRGDGNARIGAGHLMRCMTIAEELARLQGGREKICFVCADEDSGALVRENGFRSHVLGTDYRDMESELPLWRELWEKQRQEEDSGRDSDIVDRPDRGSDIADGSDSDSDIVDRSDRGSDIVDRPDRGSDIVGGFDRDIVIVDSYYVTDFYLAVLGEKAYTVLMDDMGTHRYPVDCVINYNAPASIESYRKLYQGSGTKLLIGSRYTPLRRQFGRTEEIPLDNAVLLSDSSPAPVWRQFGKTEKIPADSAGVLPDSSSAPIQRRFEEKMQEESSGNTEADTGKTGKAGRNAVREVLITAGGGDIRNIAGEILKRIYRNNFVFHLVIGRFHPDFQRMQELEKAHNNIHIHHDVKNMAELMRCCQIAVTAGGSTVYELSALGVPFVCFSCAENQEALVDYMGSRQIAVSAGAWHREPEQTLERIGKLFEELAGNPKLREACRYREMALVDGNGAQRLAEEILRLDWPAADIMH